MSVHLQREIQQLKKRLLSLCALVDEQLQMAVRAVLQGDQQLARAVRQRDAEVDRREVEVEEECLKILALHQPVAVDLRLIVAALKINNDLERIGDLAVNVARKARLVVSVSLTEPPFDLETMSRLAQQMLRDSLDAMVSLDAPLAESVCARDQQVNEMKRAIRRQVEAMIRETPQQTPGFLRLHGVSRNLERVADLATNIAEDVIYMVQGKIVRHAQPDE